MMSRDENWPDWNWQQRIAAYADGELSQDDRAQVEAWLQSHPRALDDLDCQREFAPSNVLFWSRVEPAAPTESDWNRVSANVAASLPPKHGPEPRRSHRRWWFLLSGLLLVPSSVAAAVVLTIALGNAPAPANLETPPLSASVEEVFAVLAPNDVQIESVRNADLPLIVVGDSPMQGGVTLASYTDITFVSMEPDQDGTMPQMHTGSASSMPMAYAPFSRLP